MRTVWMIGGALILAVGGAPLEARQAELAGLDAYVESAMRDWGIAGMSVAVVHGGDVVYARGFGVRDASTGEPVDEQTLFSIGSNSKLFTAVATGLLVDDSVMAWDDRIRDHLPWFDLHDPYAAKEFTLRDAMSHRSGLGRRGDALWYGTDYTRKEIIQRVRYLEPIHSFRGAYGYQNIMFLTAGEALAAAAGTSWDSFVRQRIFTPLGMRRSNTSVKPLSRVPNVAQPHAATPDGPVPIPWRDIDNVAPAGSINSSAAEMASWIRFLLAGGEYEGRRLLERTTLREIMSPHTILPAPPDTLMPSRHFVMYGLGVLLHDYKGIRVQTHTGGIDGMLSNVTTIPERDVGWVILTNTAPNGFFTALSNHLMDRYLGGDQKDWNAISLSQSERARVEAEERRLQEEQARVRGTEPSLSLASYSGTYTDALYGTARVEAASGGLRFTWGQYRDVPLAHWHHDTFVLEGSGASDQGSRTFFTFRLDARGEVEGVVVGGLGEFARDRDGGTP